MPRILLPHLLLLLGLSAPVCAAAQHRQATVLSIGDGDTLRVRQNGRAITVRLACIDAPEMAQSPHGQRVRDYLRMRLPIGSSVHLDVKTNDRYGRTVAEVIGEINIGLALVEDGQAYPLRGPSATPTGGTWISATPGSTWMPKSGPAGAATGSGMCRAASPDPGTSADPGAPPGFRMAPHPAAGGTQASMEMGMVRPVQACW